jgi:hypothetical protein
MRFTNMYECVLQYIDEVENFQGIYKPNDTEAMEALVKKIPAHPIVLDPNSEDV